MAVSNGQVANASTFNTAFMSRTIDTDTLGKVDLKNPDSVSGSNIINLQKNINALYSILGIAVNQDKDVEVSWSDGTIDNVVEKVDQLLGSIQQKYTLVNNQSATINITGFILDSTKEKSVDFIFEVERVGTIEYRQKINCSAIYKNSSWTLYFNASNGDDLLQDAVSSTEQVKLSITSVGQLQYATGNLAGHTLSRIKVYQIRMKV